MDELTFAVGACPDCDDEVLAAADLDGDLIVRVCVDCGARLEQVRWVRDDSVRAMGYGLPEKPGTPTKRGCRGGQCGVRQPASTRPQ